MRTSVADSSNVRPPALSATHVVASALAAVSAAIAASFLGVAGTVVGAALASGLSTAGTALYDHALRRTRDKLRAAPPRWGRVGITAVLVFALAMGAITLGEWVSGRSAADMVHGAVRPSDPAIVQLVEPRRGPAHTRAVDPVDQALTPATIATPSRATMPPAAAVSAPATPIVPTPTLTPIVPTPTLTPIAPTPTPSTPAPPTPAPSKTAAPTPTPTTASLPATPAGAVPTRARTAPSAVAGMPADTSVPPTPATRG